MKNTIKNTLLAAALATTSLAASAEGAQFAPLLTDPNFKLEPSLALVAGSLKPQDGSSDLYGGVELNFNCGLFQTADKRMRTHLMVGSYDKGGVELTTVELSPRYTVPMGNGFSLGVGPGIAYVSADAANQESSHFAWMIAGGVNYRSGAYYAGVDLRYQDTHDKQVAGVTRDPDNWLLAAKVGFNF